MILSLSPVTAGKNLPLEEQVALCARHHFHGLEISLDAARDLGLERSRALFSLHGVRPVSFGLPVAWRKEETQFAEDLALLRERAAFARALGVPVCVTSVLPDGGIPVADHAAVSMRRLTQIARVLSEFDLRFGLEFLGPSHFRSSPENVWFYQIDGALEVADAINAQIEKTTVGLLVDSWHWHAGGDDLMSLAAIPLEQIFHVHISDAPRGVALSDLVDHRRELPGATGEIDLTGFLSTLRALGYKGAVSVETFSDQLNSLSPDEAARAASLAMKKVFS